MFNIVLGEKNAKGQQTILLRMNENAVYQLKQKYSITIQFTMDGGAEFISSPTNVKVTQSKSKATVTPTSVTIYQSRSNEKPIEYCLTVSPNAAIIDSIHIGSSISAPIQNAIGNLDNVEVSWTENNATISFMLNDTSKLVAGKTYAIPIEIDLKGAAADSAPIKCSLNVKVLK